MVQYEWIIKKVREDLWCSPVSRSRVTTKTFFFSLTTALKRRKESVVNENEHRFTSGTLKIKKKKLPFTTLSSFSVHKWTTPDFSWVIHLCYSIEMFVFIIVIVIVYSASEGTFILDWCHQCFILLNPSLPIRWNISPCNHILMDK